MHWTIKRAEVERYFTILPSPLGIPRSAANAPKHCRYLALWQPPKFYFSLNVRPLPIERSCCNTIWCFTRVIDEVFRVFSLAVSMSKPSTVNAFLLRECWSMVSRDSIWMYAALLTLFFLLQMDFLLAFVVVTQFDGGHALPKFSGKRTLTP